MRTGTLRRVGSIALLHWQRFACNHNVLQRGWANQEMSLLEPTQRALLTTFHKRYKPEHQFPTFASAASSPSHREDGPKPTNVKNNLNEAAESTNDSQEPSNTLNGDPDTEKSETTDNVEEAAQVKLEALNSELSQKEGKIESLNMQIAELQEKSLRTLADMENLRERSARQAELSKKYAVQEFVKDLLDVADNLERATDSVPREYYEGKHIDVSEEQLDKMLRGLVEGVKLTDQILMQVFKKNGVEKYRPLDEHFDPHLHSALFEMPDQAKEPGTIAAVTKSGYKMHDRVVRPAEVGVVANEKTATQ